MPLNIYKISKCIYVNIKQNDLHDQKPHFSHGLIFIYIIYSKTLLCKQTYFWWGGGHEKPTKENWDFYTECKLHSSFYIESSLCIPFIEALLHHLLGSWAEEHENRAVIPHQEGRGLLVLWTGPLTHSPVWPGSFTARKTGVLQPGPWVTETQGQQSAGSACVATP